MRVNALLISVLTLLMVLAGALVANSLSRDMGYVLVVWQGWQLQTGVGFFLVLLVGLALLLLLLLLLFLTLSSGLGRGKRLQQQAQRQLLTQLQHAMVYQILQAPEQALDRLSLQQTQQSSGWLRLAQLYFAAQIKSHGSHLQPYLSEVPASHQVFAQLIQAEYYLQQQQPEQALPLLFLVYPVLPTDVPMHWHLALEQAVLRLWGQYAIQQPWQMLGVEPSPRLSLAAQQAWLQALRQQSTTASLEQQVSLLAYYDAQSADEHTALVGAWLQLLVTVPSADERAWLLAISDLQQQLRPEVLWLWLTLAIHSDRSATQQQQAEQLFSSLHQRYPAQPNVRLAHACWLHAQQQTTAAQQLLADWPTTELTDRFSVWCQLVDQPLLYQRLAPVLHEFTMVEYVL